MNDGESGPITITLLLLLLLLVVSSSSSASRCGCGRSPVCCCCSRSETRLGRNIRPDRSGIFVGDARDSAGVGGHLPSWGISTLSCATNDTRNPHTIRNQATAIRMIEAMQ